MNNDYLEEISNNIEEGVFFINNKENFIFFEKTQRLYKLEILHENNFYLKEYDFNIEFKNTLKYLKKLYEFEIYNKNKLNTKLLSILNPKSYYLINKKWMEEYKNFYNYDKIIKYINQDDKLYSFLNNKNSFPNELKDVNFIYPESFQFNNFYFPTNFEIISKKLFDLIIQEINIKNNINLRVNNPNLMFFADNKVFIQDISNNKLYYIYSFNNDNYKIEYIILFQNNSDLIYFLQYSNDDENFEELITNFGIDITENKQQILLDDNLQKIADFYNINKKHKIRLKEPNHCLGLENIGATCYMNATIQCLCHILNMKNYFKKKQLVFNDINNKHCPLTKEFYKVLNNLWKFSSNGKTYYTPRDFKNKISEMNPLFQGIAANDSKDLIIFLYETMHNEINKTNQYIPNNYNYNQNNDLQIFRQNYYSNNSSFLIKTFYFEQQSDLCCFNCNFTKTSYNITNILIFPLEKVREYMIKKCPNGFMTVTLDNCFENYQDVEVLNGPNQIFCNNCRTMSNASTGNKMFTSPEVMTIILNRGKGLEFEVEFEYPLKLNIDKYVMDKEIKNNNYELICVLTHIGPSGMAGHFIAFCKMDEKWYCYNDATVSQINDPRYQNNQQFKGIPYVLFYQKYNANKELNNIDNNKIYPSSNINYNNINYSNNNYNNNYYNNKSDNKGYYDSNKRNIGNIQNKITLYFQYNDKEVYLDIEKNIKIDEIINKLNIKYKIPKDVTLFIQKNNYVKLLPSKTVKEYRLNDGDKITVIQNQPYYK